LLVIGAGIETLARRYFKAAGFDPKPALKDLSSVVAAVRAGAVKDVLPKFSDRLAGFKQMMSGLGAKDLFRTISSGTHLDFTEDEIKSWGEGRNSPAHGKWPGPNDGIPYLFAMITMLHKILLRTIRWNLPLTDFATPGWPLLQPFDFPAADNRPSNDKIRELAYFLWEKRGGGHGDDLSDWYIAETELNMPGRGSGEMPLRLAVLPEPQIPKTY
jgi:hypothetical protein